MLTQKKAIAEVNLKAIDAGVRLVEEGTYVK